MSEQHCTHCGGFDLEQGFLDDAGDSAPGYTRWIPGPLELEPFGGAKRIGKRRFAVHAHRCRSCSHLELFAPRK
ncbi:hypothetical protein [Nocardia crassostreae]|uniref:hypothetical protein n=1 Tax=Nocardia crassostreae TaxID=53428 RepID=UPI00083794D7|nr:hypothetical protein [Nocardia crassostreae]